MVTALQVLSAVVIVPLVLLILLHKGTGDGVGDMLGGGAGADLSKRSVGASRNLTALTVTAAAIWSLSAVVVALLTQ